MATIHFNAVIDREQVIRPPTGIMLPEGEIEVTVKLREPSQKASDALESTRDWLLDLATEAEKANPNLPSDLAEHHDHYAHGKPIP